VYQSGVTVFDCTKCVGYENGGVEVIIESIPLVVGTGTTEVSCIELNNKVSCDKVYIKNIDDGVTFNGTFNTFIR
jgi:hypothetical protein